MVVLRVWELKPNIYLSVYKDDIYDEADYYNHDDDDNEN